jgi:hypothetical protein
MPNFGHYDVKLYDDCYRLWYEVYGTPLSDNWLPLSQIALCEFCFGVGPLCVPSGVKLVPDEFQVPRALTEAMKYLIKKMKVVFPPLPVFTPFEMKLFSKLLSAVKTKNPNFEELQRQWVEHVDCVKVYPKLPSHLRSYHTRWKKTRNREDTVRSRASDLESLRATLRLSANSIEFPVPPPAIKRCVRYGQRRGKDLVQQKNACSWKTCCSDHQGRG